MDNSKLRVGDVIAAVSGVALMIVMCFSWYGYQLRGTKLYEGAADRVVGRATDTTLTAWQAFGVIDVLIAFVAICAVGALLLRATQHAVAPSVAASVAVTILGALAVLLVLFRILDKPDQGFGDLVDVKLQFGAILGVIASAGIAYGGFRSMSDEGTTFTDVTAGGTAPAPTPAPPVVPAPPRDDA